MLSRAGAPPFSATAPTVMRVFVNAKVPSLERMGESVAALSVALDPAGVAAGDAVVMPATHAFAAVRFLTVRWL